MYSEFKDILLTVEDRNDLLTEISDVSEVEFSTNPDQMNEVLSKKIRSEYRDLWKQFLEKNRTNKVNWQGWKEELTNIPVIQLRVPVQLTRAFIAQIASMLQEVKVKETFLLQIDHVPQLLGGIQVVIDGKLTDFSLSSKLQTYIQQNEQEIRTLLFASPSNNS